MFVLLAMFAAGVLHGLGPDHLAAIGALLGREGGRRAPRELAWLGLRFGLGHVTSLIALAGVAWVLGRNLPDSWQHALEQLSGVVLIFLGGWVLAEAFRRRVTLHSHPHTHGHGGLEHEHVHIHLGSPERHRHPHFEFLAGGLTGFSGAQALLAAMPVVLAGSPAAALARILAFGLGIVAAMAAAGWLAHQALARLGRTPAYARWLAGATGAMTAALGAYWLARFAAG